MIAVNSFSRKAPRYLIFIAAIFSLVPPAIANPHQSQGKPPASLEVRLTSPPRWENGCLLVSLDRINRSSSSIYLTKMGPYFYIALSVSPTGPEEVNWVNVYGVSDLKTSDAVPLLPASTVHNEFCLAPTIWVVDREKQTHREIPVRGKLRIDASFFSSEDAWRANKESHSKNVIPPLRPDAPVNVPEPEWSRTFAAIPCPPNSNCIGSCQQPPSGLQGEYRAVPDVYGLDPEWNARGKLLTEELNTKFPGCYH
jgi:hypothetical protein